MSDTWFPAGIGEAPDSPPVEVAIRIEAKVRIWSETALFFAAAAHLMDPRATDGSFDERVEDLSAERWAPLLRLLDIDRIVRDLPGVDLTERSCVVDAPSWEDE